jgi:hypothetical protein
LNVLVSVEDLRGEDTLEAIGPHAIVLLRRKSREPMLHPQVTTMFVVALIKLMVHRLALRVIKVITPRA